MIFEGAGKIMVDIIFLAVHQGLFVSDVLADLKWLWLKEVVPNALLFEDLRAA